MTDLLPALLRTVVPAIYGWLILHFGVDRWVSSDVAQPIIGLALMALIYVVLRLLEHLKPWFGILLGWIGQPQYGTTIDAVLEDSNAGIVEEIEDSLEKVKAEIMEHVATTVEQKVAASLTASTTAEKASKPAAVESAETSPVQLEATAAPAATSSSATLAKSHVGVGTAAQKPTAPKPAAKKAPAKKTAAKRATSAATRKA